MRAPLRAAALAVVVVAPLVLVGLGRAPFDDPGEGMHAEIARELLRSGDPFALTLGGVRYVDKPPLLYTLIAGVVAVAGPREWAARLPSAVAALAAVAATAWLGAHVLGGARAGVLAGVALGTSLGFFAYARYVRPETLLVALLAAGFAWLLVGLRQQRRGLVIAGLVAFGAAGLAKDAVAALAPPLSVALALVLGGRVRPFGAWLPAPGVAIGLALAVGWWIVAEARTPGFSWYTIVDNHLLNVARARRFPDEDVPLGAAEFLTVAAIAAAPWVLAAAVTVVHMARRRAWRDPEETTWVVLAVWALGVLTAMTISPFRLPHYGLPAGPAIALLAARAWATARGPGLALAHLALFAALGVACLAGWSSDGDAFASRVMAAADVATRKSELARHESGKPPWDDIRPLLGAAGVVLVLGAAGLAAARRHAAPSMRGALVVGLTMMAMMPIVASALALVSSHRAVRPLAVEVARRIGPADTLAHEGPLENSGALEWYAGRRPVIVDGRRSVLGFGATLSGAGENFWEREQLQHAWAGPHRVWLITTRAPDDGVVAGLPHARLVAGGAGRRLYVNRID